MYESVWMCECEIAERERTAKSRVDQFLSWLLITKSFFALLNIQISFRWSTYIEPRCVAEILRWDRYGSVQGERTGSRVSSPSSENSPWKFLRRNEHAACISEANADDSSFLLDAGYFRPATIFEADSSRGFAAVLVRVCARWPTQHHRRCRRRRRETLYRQISRSKVTAKTTIRQKVPRWWRRAHFAFESRPERNGFDGGVVDIEIIFVSKSKEGSRIYSFGSRKCFKSNELQRIDLSNTRIRRIVSISYHRRVVGKVCPTTQNCSTWI